MCASDSTEQHQYQDFELSIVAARETHTYLVTARSTAGLASDESVIDPAADAWRTALDAIAREDTDEAFFLELGARLFDALFPGDVEDAYRAATGYARGEGKGLRLRLRLTQASEIAALPWEYVHDPQRDIFFAVSSDTPLSRFIEPQQVFPPPPPPEGKLRLLAVVSDPENLDNYGLQHLDAAKELETLNEALQRLKAQDLLEEIPPLHHAVRADISEALRTHRPHVLHFIGHGAFANRRGFLILEDEDHYALEMSDRAFRELLEGQPDTRLVLLNACQGATRAAGDAMVGMGPQLVSRGVPAVVAMQYPVYDRAAIGFTREFYRALAHWYPIDVALSQARRAVYLDFGLDRRDWGVPVLFMRDRDGVLLTAPQKAAQAAKPTASSGDLVDKTAKLNRILLQKIEGTEEWQVHLKDQQKPIWELIDDAVVEKAVKMRSCSGNAMDYSVKPSAKDGTWVEFDMKLDRDALFYANIDLQKNDGSTLPNAWLQFEVGAGDPKRLSGSSSEWIVYVQPDEYKEEGWLLFRIDLPDAIMRSFGNDGWRFVQLNRFRFRGSLFYKQIRVYKSTVNES